MNKQCKEFAAYITSYAPKHNKEAVEADASARYHLTRDRKVYHNGYFAVRFSYSKATSDYFSNTVLSLSALEKYDKIPFFVVLVRQEADNLILLANTTMIKKISHSSQGLRMDNIKGSFNGPDIMRSYDGIANSPENFDFLFAVHQGLEWEDNLLRLVEASSGIKPTIPKFCPTATETEHIMASVDRAAQFVMSSHFKTLEDDLNNRCKLAAKEILIASHIENTNICGRLIESLIVSDERERQRLMDSLHDIEQALPCYDAQNGLGDYYREFDKEDTYTDIKTKVIYLNSNPKAYNIDKFLRQMSDSRSVFLFFFIGIDEHGIFKNLLCSVYHAALIDSPILQSHWAGRGTRGSAQFNGSIIDAMLNKEHFQNHIIPEKARSFLEMLLAR